MSAQRPLLVVDRGLLPGANFLRCQQLTTVDYSQDQDPIRFAIDPIDHSVISGQNLAPWLIRELGN